METGPHIVTAPKTRFFPSRIGAAVAEAVDAVRGTPVSTPVVVDGFDVAVVRGEGWRDPRVRVWLPSSVKPHRKWAGWTTYADLDAAMRMGGEFSARYSTNTSFSSSWIDGWSNLVVPVAGTFTGAANTARQFDYTVAGSLRLQQGGTKQTYASRFTAGTNTTTSLGAWLYDRVLTYEACPLINGSTNMTNGVAAQRYNAAGEPGLQICVTLQTSIGATTGSITVLNYVDQDGNAGAMPYDATAGNIVPNLSSVGRVLSPSNGATALSWGPFLPLAAQDTGVRSITDWTHTAANTGTLCFVLMYPLCYVPTIDRASTAVTYNEAAWPINMPFARIYEGAHLSVLIRGATNGGSTPTMRGHVEVAIG